MTTGLQLILNRGIALIDVRLNLWGNRCVPIGVKQADMVSSQH